MATSVTLDGRNDLAGRKYENVYIDTSYTTALSDGLSNT
jgi:hypothetical protein